MNTLIRLDHDAAFTRVKQALVSLWEGRSTLALHEIEIREYKVDKQRYQEKFYWGYVVTPFAEFCGYTPEQMHRIICCELYGTHEVEFNGKKYPMPNRTTTSPKKMNVAEYDKHILMASAMAGEQGVYVEPWSNAA